MDDKEYTVTSPSLSAAKFEELLAPFLDTELLYARETEYRLTCSIFAPIQDALDRAGVDLSDVGSACRLVGAVTSRSSSKPWMNILTKQSYYALVILNS